jgi:competence protein ComEC
LFFYDFFIFFVYTAMMRIQKKHWPLFVIALLIMANLFVWYVVWREQPTNYTTVAFLNIGQGDAIYIESPTHAQMLIDGGPSQIILSELRKVMPFYDRDIDTILVTNPDKDHFAGFVNVLNSFDIHKVVEPGTLTTTEIYKTFEKDVLAEHAQKIIARRGMVFDMGEGTKFTILFPDKDVSTFSTNDGSIVARLTYGSTSVMFTGDAPNKTEEYTLAISGEDEVHSDILKEGHHGSRTSASEIFIRAVNPKWDVISAGYHNSYGHPHKETIDLLNKLHIPYLITYEQGTIIFHCTKTECRRQ